MNFKAAFATRLKKLREYAELTQDELAKKLGVSRGSISYYEKQERVPDIEFLEKVSDYFGLDPGFMLGVSDNAFTDNKEIGLTLGLTDQAIEKLEKLADDSLGDDNTDDVILGHQNRMFNYFVESRQFNNFLDLLKGYCKGIYSKYGNYSDDTYKVNKFSKFYKTYVPAPYEDIGYIEYLLSNTIIQMLQDIRESYNMKNSSDYIKIKSEIKKGRQPKEILEEILNKCSENQTQTEANYRDERNVQLNDRVEELKKQAEKVNAEYEASGQAKNDEIRAKVHKKLRGEK